MAGRIFLEWDGEIPNLCLNLGVKCRPDEAAAVIQYLFQRVPDIAKNFTENEMEIKVRERTQWNVKN